jgi:site-specific DNA recombinase
VRKGLRTKAAEGLWPSFAPLGYRSAVRGDGKHIIEPDPVFGPIVTQLLEWFVTAEYSVQRLAARAYDAGLRFRKSNGRIPVGSLHKLLRNPIYMGEFDYGGVATTETHEPLVSCQVWDRIQEILDARNRRKNRKLTRDFAFSGMVVCGHCGCSLVGEVKKGQYVHYHCTGYRVMCGEPYMVGGGTDELGTNRSDGPDGGDKAP